MSTPTVHATAVSIGGRGVLIRGPSGSGKSRLAFELISAGYSAPALVCRLVADDRVLLSAERDRLVAQPAPNLQGLIEIHGLGIRRCGFEPQVTVALVVDLAATDAARMPEETSLKTVVEGITLPRIPVAAGFSGLPLVLAALTTDPLASRP